MSESLRRFLAWAGQYGWWLAIIASVGILLPGDWAWIAVGIVAFFAAAGLVVSLSRFRQLEPGQRRLWYAWWLAVAALVVAVEVDTE